VTPTSRVSTPPAPSRAALCRTWKGPKLSIDEDLVMSLSCIVSKTGTSSEVHRAFRSSHFPKQSDEGEQSDEGTDSLYRLASALAGGSFCCLSSPNPDSESNQRVLAGLRSGWHSSGLTLHYQAGGWRLGLSKAWRQPVSCVLRHTPPHFLLVAYGQCRQPHGLHPP
jgi:hypothetical protein